MKVSQQKDVFKPVTVTLESSAEAGSILVAISGYRNAYRSDSRYVENMFYLDKLYAELKNCVNQ